MDRMSEEPPNSLFVSCSCGGEGANFVQDPDTGEVYLAVWYYNRTDLSVRHKIRWIWKIIQGDPFPDEIVIGVGWLPLIIDKLGAMRNVAEQIAERKVNRKT